MNERQTTNLPHGVCWIAPDRRRKVVLATGTHALRRQRTCGWRKFFYRAQVSVGGKIYHIGNYRDIEAAARAYDEALFLLSDAQLVPWYFRFNDEDSFTVGSQLVNRSLVTISPEIEAWFCRFIGDSLYDCREAASDADLETELKACNQRWVTVVDKVGKVSHPDASAINARLKLRREGRRSDSEALELQASIRRYYASRRIPLVREKTTVSPFRSRDVVLPKGVKRSARSDRGVKRGPNKRTQVVAPATTSTWSYEI